MTSLAMTSKLCSTCAFWAGSRKVKPDGRVESTPTPRATVRAAAFSMP